MRVFLSSSSYFFSLVSADYLSYFLGTWIALYLIEKFLIKSRRFLQENWSMFHDLWCVNRVKRSECHLPIVFRNNDDCTISLYILVTLFDFNLLFQKQQSMLKKLHMYFFPGKIHSCRRHFQLSLWVQKKLTITIDRRVKQSYPCHFLNIGGYMSYHVSTFKKGSQKNGTRAYLPGNSYKTPDLSHYSNWYKTSLSWQALKARIQHSTTFGKSTKKLPLFWWYFQQWSRSAVFLRDTLTEQLFLQIWQVVWNFLFYFLDQGFDQVPWCKTFSQIWRPRVVRKGPIVVHRGIWNMPEKQLESEEDWVKL